MAHNHKNFTCGVTVTEPHHSIFLVAHVVGGYFISSKRMILIKIVFFLQLTFCVTQSPHKALELCGASVFPPRKCHGRHVGILYGGNWGYQYQYGLLTTGMPMYRV
jgi:hypothetical protein